MPQQAIDKQRPIIHIMRNPKDVCVSYYNHFQTLPTYEDLDNFSAFLPMFTGDNGFCKLVVVYLVLNHGWIQRGGGRGSGTPTPEKSQKQRGS